MSLPTKLGALALLCESGGLCVKTSSHAKAQSRDNKVNFIDVKAFRCHRTGGKDLIFRCGNL